MKIKESLMNQSFSVSNSDPYLFSLQVMRDLFAQQAADGKVPNLPPQNAAIN